MSHTYHGDGHCRHAPKCIGVGEPDDRDPFGCCNCGSREAEKHPGTRGARPTAAQGAGTYMDHKMTQDDRDRIHLFLANENGPVLPEGLPVEAAKYADPHQKSEIMDRAGLSLGEAIHLLKGGKRMARAGWNGKGMWLAYQKGYPQGIPINANTAQATGLPEGAVCVFRPYIMMRDAQGSFVPWLASQTDMLAEDWMEVES